jgi:hypothetical protein
LFTSSLPLCLHLHIEAEQPEKGHEGGAEQQVGLHEASRKYTFTGRGEAVGELVSVKDRSPAGRSSHERDVAVFAVVGIDIGRFLEGPDGH